MQLGLFGCGEWKTLQERLKLLLQQAEASGATSSNAYVAAKSYYDSTDSWWELAVLTGDACTAEVKEINNRISNLTNALKVTGIAPVIENSPEIGPSETTFDSLTGMVKWIVGGAAVVSAAVIAYQIVPFFQPRRSRRYRGYWDPEQRDLEGVRRRKKRSRR